MSLIICFVDCTQIINHFFDHLGILREHSEQGILCRSLPHTIQGLDRAISFLRLKNCAIYRGHSLYPVSSVGNLDDELRPRLWHIICESSYETALRGKQVALQQVADYARTGKAEFVVSKGGGAFTLAVHNPGWAASCKASVNGKEVKAKLRDGYLCIKRGWKDGDRLTLEFPFVIRTVEKTWEYRNAGPKEHNFPNWYNGFTKHYVTFAAGPLVFATDHPDSFEKQDPLGLTRAEIDAARLVRTAAENSNGTCAVMAATPELHVGGLVLKPIAMMPPFEDGPQWRATWFQIK